MKQKISEKYSRILVCTVLVISTFIFAFQGDTAYAGSITLRKLTLQSKTPISTHDGGSKPGGSVDHAFAFTLPSVGNTNVGSIKFQYCLEPSGTCTLPTGLVTTAVTLGSETGVTGFSMVSTTNGAPYLTRTSASVTAGTAASYVLATITNPTTTNQTFYVRISTFASIDTTGGAIDTGVVAGSTATQIVLTGTMPESLIFCAGATVGTTSSVPDCSKATAGTVSFNQLFSPADTATATSQMAASTNAGSGYSITVNGVTMTSGANTIIAMNAASAGIRGSSQFGLNLKLNTTATSTVAVGAEINPSSNGTNFRGQAASGYNTVDTFKFTTGESIADSANGGAGGTDAQIYTVSYIVNVSGGQAAGTYTTTLTYICTPTF
jgi:hypothetical protein